MKIRTNKGFLKMPWSMEDTIENLRDIKVMMKQILLRANKDGKGEEDVKEVDFDFNRAINALEKQIPKKPKIQTLKEDYLEYFKCPVCKKTIISRLEGDMIAGRLQKYCDNCGQALDWNEVQENDRV